MREEVRTTVPEIDREAEISYSVNNYVELPILSSFSSEKERQTKGRREREILEHNEN